MSLFCFLCGLTPICQGMSTRPVRGTHIAVVGRPMLAALRAAQSEPIFGAEPTETQPPLSSGQEIDQRQNGAQSTRPEQIQQSPHTQRGRGRGANPKRKTRRSRGV